MRLLKTMALVTIRISAVCSKSICTYHRVISCILFRTVCGRRKNRERAYAACILCLHGTDYIFVDEMLAYCWKT